MKIKQLLNNYKEEYKITKNWEILETSHYVFHYNKNSEASNDIDLISQTQEKAYRKIVSVLHLTRLGEKIKYYLYSSENEKKEYMGDNGNGQAIWHDYSIHIIYSGKIKPLGEHEDTHLLTLDWGVAIAFFQEGLAEYMNSCVWKDQKTRKYIPSITFIKKAYSNNINVRLENFFEHKFWDETIRDKYWYYYPLSGVFTKFLIENYGVEKYKKFYMLINRKQSKKEVLDNFKKIFDPINKIEKTFETSNNLNSIEIQ